MFKDKLLNPKRCGSWNGMKYNFKRMTIVYDDPNDLVDPRDYRVTLAVSFYDGIPDDMI